MTTKPILYSLEIYQLHGSYREIDDLSGATLLDHYYTSSSFGAFHVGDTINEGHLMAILGTVAHVHHWVGDYGEDQVLHKTCLYLDINLS